MTAGVHGNLYTMASTYIKVAVEYSEDYSISNNTSDVTLTLWYQRTNSYGYSTYAYGNYQVRLGDTFYTVYSGTFTIPAYDNNWHSVGSVTVRGVQHGANGAERVKIGGKFANTGQGVSVMDFNFYDNVDLTTIPRASKPTYSTNPLTIGQTQTITTNRASTGFTHTLVLSMGDYSETLSNVGASTTWTPTAADLMQYMDTWQKEVTVTCTTYNGSTQIGTSTTKFTLQVDTSVYKPVIAWGTATDTNATTVALETAGSFIKSYSNLQIQVTATPNDTTYGDTVDTLTVALGNVSQQSAAGGLSVMVNFMTNGITTATLTATATDSRGYSVTATKTLTLIDYSPIVIESIITARVNANGEPTETGEYIKYTIKGSAFLGSFGQVTNTIKVRTKSKLVSAADYGSWVDEQTVTTSGSGFAQYTINGITVGTYLSSTQYDMIFRLEDALTARQSGVVRIHEGIPVYAWGRDHFDVYGEFHIHDRDDVMKYSTIYPDGYRWQLAGTGNGTNAVNFDSAICSEIMLVAKYVENSSNTWVATATIPTDALDPNGFFLMMPARIYSSAQYDRGCLIEITDYFARINEFFNNRSSVASNASLSVYYR